MQKERRVPPLTLFATALITLVMDQLSKAIVRIHLPLGETVSLGFLEFRQVRNPGTAFGLITSKAWPLFVVSIVLFFVLILVLWKWGGPGSRVFQMGLGLIIGGALGNIIDRLTLGEVVDFIDVGFWPVFNIADIAIVAGVGIVLVIVAKQTWKGENEADRET
ncbi:MAG: signal peptidase II [Actinomycetota bacterium]|nr:signal peptidase II [Actinomycetota bacterium]